MILALFLMALATYYGSGLGCPQGWLQFRDSCYSFGQERVTWQDASQYCELYDSHLVAIDNADENDWLVKSMKGRGLSTAWTGGTERLHRGSWEWISTKKPFGRFADWYGTEPLGLEEDCMAIDGGLENRWNDMSCILSYQFICERGAEKEGGVSSNGQDDI